jgi:hypothetical protein
VKHHDECVLKHHEFDLAEGESIICDTPYGTTVTIRVLEIHEPSQEVVLEIHSCVDVTLYVGTGPGREIGGMPKCQGLPRLLLLFSFLLSHDRRREVFFPAFNEFLEDYLFARRNFKRKWDKRCLAAAFCWRVVGIVTACWKMELTSLFMLTSSAIAACFRWQRKD